jgi:hypothetical protein
VPWRIDDDVVASPGFKPDLRDIDGDILVPLRLERIHEERPFEPHPATTADGLDLFEFPIGQGSGLIQQTADQGRFSVINVANDDHT